MPSVCPAPLRPATQDAQNTVYRFWVSGGGIGVYPTGRWQQLATGSSVVLRQARGDFSNYRVT